ncbi:MAG: hypothetical protein U5N85_15050 [Arcicella sp.]|nr:hypothetical protein [Arcicella sp.]
MARNQIEKYVNELNIRKNDYLKKQQNEYKIARFEKSLDILKRASYSQTIPDETIEEIKLIFKLMPVHELYYIKTASEYEFKEYIERLNKLYIAVLDKYESEPQIVNSKSRNVIIVFVYAMFIFHKSIENWLGIYAIPTVLGCFLIFWIYENRWRFHDSFFFQK